MCRTPKIIIKQPLAPLPLTTKDVLAFLQNIQTYIFISFCIPLPHFPHTRTVEENVMAAAGIKINISEEGSSFNWVEEVEREDPSSWWSRFEAKPVKRPVKVKVKEVRLKKETTYPYFVPIGSYLAIKLGKESGARIEKQLEENYKALIMREPGVCRNPDNPNFRAFDVEKLPQGALQRLIRGWESGLEIVDVGKGGKTQLCAVLHAMSPNSCPVNSVTPVTPVTTKEEASKDTRSDQIKGVEKEVIFF